MKRAFSLLEVMVAASLFLLSLTGVLSGLRTLAGVEEHQRRITAATTIGEMAMEEMLLRFVGHPELDVGRTNTRFFDRQGALATTLPTGGYTTTLTVGRVEGIPTLKEMRLVVSWSESTGPKTLEYFTYRP